jgi:hypothetical protein
VTPPLQVLGMALHHHVLVEHSFATFFLQAILNRHTTIQGAAASAALLSPPMTILSHVRKNRHRC